MSKFSNKCKELLIENGTNVYRLSANTDLERTTLQRMVTGKRLPNIEFIKTFCNVLRLSKIEEDELMELYRMESIGEDAYNSEQSILTLFKHLRELEDHENKSCASPFAYIESRKSKLTSNSSSNITDTELLMNFVLDEEFSNAKHGFIYTNFPGESLSFLHTLELLYSTYHKKIHIRHLIQFHMNASSASKNLNTLNQVLPLFMANTLDYNVFYYYSRLTEPDCEHMLFPYYIITSKHVLLISANCQRGLLLSDENTIQQYIIRFKELNRLAKPLFHKTNLLGHVWQSYRSNFTETKDEVFFFHYEPCYLSMTGHKLFLKNVHSFLSNFRIIGEQFSEQISRNSKRQNLAFYSDEGLDEFTENGKYYGQVGVLFPTMDKKQRLESLQNFTNNNEFYNHRMLKSEFISFPKNLYFELQGTKLLQIIRLKSLKDIDFITIVESSICEAFYEFFKSLKTSKYIYEEEQEQTYLKEKISQLTYASTPATIE